MAREVVSSLGGVTRDRTVWERLEGPEIGTSTDFTGNVGIRGFVRKTNRFFIVRQP